MTVPTTIILASLLFMGNHRGAQNVSSFTIVSLRTSRHASGLLADHRDRSHLHPSKMRVIEPLDTVPTQSTSSGSTLNRRAALSSMYTVASLLAASNIAAASTGDELESLSLGAGRWSRLSRQKHLFSSARNPHVPSAFVTYATRLLINYDTSVNAWWDGLTRTSRLLPEEKRQAKLRKEFGAMAKSLEVSLVDYIKEQRSPKEAYEDLWDRFMVMYGFNDESRRQIALLFALLPRVDQPVSRLKSMTTSNFTSSASIKPLSTLQNDLTELLSTSYSCVSVEESSYFTVYPSLDFIFDGDATSPDFTYFGPVAKSPLVRDQAKYQLSTYACLGLSGAIGCSLTHAVVIPIDVVKTRSQIQSGPSKGFLDTGLQVLQQEGTQGLFLGAQATLVGYLWYGASVYPCYTFFKRMISLGLLPADVVAANTDAIALVAGALASVVAGIGLTPLEAARIRVVASPRKYRALGLSGTLRSIAKENPDAGWSNLYSGLTSLLTRQVIFGSVKFLAFERTCAYIFSVWPALHDELWTSLTVSLIAGAISGALSAIISQPADAVLTYVAQGGNPQGSFLSAGLEMARKEGLSSLFRGVGSRCVWATCIIAGQFLLYDTFRACSGVSPDDLTQVFQLVLSPDSQLDSST